MVKIFTSEVVFFKVVYWFHVVFPCLFTKGSPPRPICRFKFPLTRFQRQPRFQGSLSFSRQEREPWRRGCPYGKLDTYVNLDVYFW